MNVLIVNTYHYFRAGAERHALELGELIKHAGHEVHYFAMKCKKNIKCIDEKFFINEIDYQEMIKKKSVSNIIKVLFNSIYSYEAKQNISLLLDTVKPDIAHLHSIRHHLTKSILT